MILRALLLLLMVFSAQAEDKVDPKALLDGMARAFRELNYDISFVYMRDGVAEPMRLVHALDSGRERERLVHLNGQPREVVREDDSVIAYFANRAPVALDKPQAPTLWTQALVDNLNQMHQHYDLIDRGETRVAGRDARQIDVRSSDGQRYGYRMWFDDDSGLLLRSDIIDSDARVLEQWQVISIKLLTDVPDADLRVGAGMMTAAVPTTASVTPVAMATTQSDLPGDWAVSWLPDGFVLKSSQWQQTHSQSIQHLLFSDGVAAISVYVAPPLPNGLSLARVYQRGGMTIYEAGNAQSHVTVVGDVPTVTARRIAQSVRHNAEAVK